MNLLLPPLQSRLKNIKESNQYRSLKIHAGKDFCSNDYLGFAKDTDFKSRCMNALKSIDAGATGSRLVSGEHEVLIDAEQFLANRCGQESSLLLPSGYQANLALMSALLNEGDVVFSDEYNHASLIDGMRLTKAARCIFRHDDLNDLEELLKMHVSSQGLKLVVCESVYSMQGDLAPLKDISQICKKYDAYLVVDEAHATGMYGEQGAGRISELGIQQDVLATIHTGGKALGATGAWIACDAQIKDYLINFSRPFIFSTGMSPLVATVLKQSFLYWDVVGKKRAEAVLVAAGYFYKSCKKHENHFQVLGGESPIVPIILGENECALQAAKVLQDKGFDVRAIRPPTVPQGTARLRITITYPQTRIGVADLIRTMDLILKKAA